jgi:hypothetical protein
MGQLYNTQKSKYKNKGKVATITPPLAPPGAPIANFTDYVKEYVKEADRRAKRKDANAPLIYKDKKSTANLKKIINSDFSLFPNDFKDKNFTPEKIDSIAANHFRAYKKIFNENNAPAINIGENIIPRTHYNEPANSIELSNAQNKSLLAELAHAKQIKDGKSVWGQAVLDWFKNPYISDEGQYKMYEKPGTVEYEAHKVIEPKLRDQYNKYLKENAQYKNYIDNSDSAYNFANGGRVYRSFPEYDKAREIYQQEKKKAENYNSLEAELYGLSGQTQGNTENYKQLGDMFNNLSPAQQDAMAAKYKAEFVTNVPSAQRRNYINSMEMTVPGKGTGYYSFPSNATVYGTQVLEKPLMQMDRMQMSQVKPVQQLSDGFKPSMNQRISMPGMRMPVSQSTQSMSQPTKGYTSVVDLLNSRKMDSSFASRKKMAEERGIKNYTGSSMQNKELNSRLMNEQFGNGGNLTMYGPGGQLPPKEYNNLKDFQKAEKLYTDSLTTYNNSIIRRAEVIQNYKNAKNRKELEEANKKTKAKYPINENIKIPNKREEIFVKKFPDGTDHLVSDRHFKKPVQPVVYRPPAKHVQKLNEKLMKPFYSYGVKPTTSLERMEVIPHTLDNPKVVPHGELIPITPMTLPQQGNTPFYGPGGTTVGYTNEKMEFYPAQKYTGAPNNPLNLQDKELLDNPEMLKKYALSKDNYKFSYGGKLSGKYLKMLAYGGDFLNQPNLGEDREGEIDYTERAEPSLESLNGIPYQLPTTKSLVGKPTGTPITMPTGQTATVNLGETTEDGLGLKKALGADKISENGVNALNAGIQLGTSFLASQMERKKNPNSTYTYDGQNRTVEGAKGLSTGFALGNKVLPGVGGVVGAFAGGIYGMARGSKMDKQAKLDRSYQDRLFKQSRDLEMEGRQRLQGEQQYGRNTQMYADGGSLSAKFLAGLNPNVSQTSSSTTEIHGKSHENGGVPLKNMNAEVEAGETTAGDYVFSKRLGFAAVHKPIAKAKGLIEGKPATKERLNSLKLLQEKENKLSLAQEYIKNTLNLQ